jgi:hypothetical protein
MALPLFHALKSSITGQFEITRLIGGLGGLSYVIGTHAFLYWKCIHLGQDFPLETYCLAFPTGLAAIGGGTAASVALKDRQSATSAIIAATGALPAKPAEPPATTPMPPVAPLAPAVAPGVEPADL